MDLLYKLHGSEARHVSRCYNANKPDVDDYLIQFIADERQYRKPKVLKPANLAEGALLLDRVADWRFEPDDNW